jgi:phage FluMu protein Com
MMIDIRCPKCERWLGKSYGTTIAILKCSNSKCKFNGRVKIVDSSSSLSDIRVKFPSEVAEKPIMTESVPTAEEIKEMKTMLAEMDGRTKEAKKQKKHIKDLESYIAQLEGIIDGQS